MHYHLEKKYINMKKYLKSVNDRVYKSLLFWLLPDWCRW